MFLEFGVLADLGEFHLGHERGEVTEARNLLLVVLRQLASRRMYVVVVYHVTIVAIGHGLLKKFWPLVLGCVLRTVGSSII